MSCVSNVSIQLLETMLITNRFSFFIFFSFIPQRSNHSRTNPAPKHNTGTTASATTTTSYTLELAAITAAVDQSGYIAIKKHSL